MTGEAWSYTNWYGANSEPNNYPWNDPNGESVLELGRFQDSPRSWNDLDPHMIGQSKNYMPGYIIEWNSNPNTNPVPEPASILLLGLGGAGMLLRRLRKEKAV